MLDQHYSKTAAGRAEIKTRSLVSARVARNLLLVLDASKSARQWLGLVQGASEADFQLLLDQGLIASESGGTASAGPAASPVAIAPANADALPQMDYEQLYGYLTRHAKQYLGLMKGYRVVLDVERCSGLPELQAFALRFVDMVREAQGEELATQVRRAMGIKG